MHFVPPLSSILPSGNETMVPFAKLLSLSSKPTAVFCCDARVPQVRLSARLLLPAGTGGVGKARTGAAVPALCSCSRCGSSGSAQRGSCYSLGFFWRPQSQPRGTHGDTPQVLRCQQQPSNVLSSESGSSPAGPSSECLGSDHPTASLCPPAPGVGLLPAVILITSVFPKPCPSNPQYRST